MLLIGLNGRLRSGKDTAYNILAGHPSFKASFQRVGFADKLKLSLVRSLGFDISDPSEAVELANQIKDDAHIALTRWHSRGSTPKWVKGFSGRELQQWWGTEGHRDVFGKDFWVDALLPRPAGLATDNPYWGHEFTDRQRTSWSRSFHRDALNQRLGVSDVTVVTDTRYPNEAQRIFDLGGVVWRIDADDRLGPLPPDAHISEYGLPDELVTRVIDNNADEHAFTVNVNQAYMETVSPSDA